MLAPIHINDTHSFKSLVQRNNDYFGQLDAIRDQGTQQVYQQDNKIDNYLNDSYLKKTIPQRDNSRQKMNSNESGCGNIKKLVQQSNKYWNDERQLFNVQQDSKDQNCDNRNIKQIFNKKREAVIFNRPRNFDCEDISLEDERAVSRAESAQCGGVSYCSEMQEQVEDKQVESYIDRVIGLDRKCQIKDQKLSLLIEGQKELEEEEFNDHIQQMHNMKSKQEYQMEKVIKKTSEFQVAPPMIREEEEEIDSTKSERFESECQSELCEITRWKQEDKNPFNKEKKKTLLIDTQTVNSGESQRQYSQYSCSSRKNSQLGYGLNYIKKQACELPSNMLHDSLQVIDISNNKLRCIPNEIWSIHNLKVFRINNNYISSLTGQFHSLLALEAFSISDNLISIIPDNINAWSDSLKLLDISKNRISCLEPLCPLKNLQSLHIQNNEFRCIPCDLHELSKLQEISLDWFEYTHPKLDMNQKGIKGRNNINQLLKLLFLNLNSFQSIITAMSSTRNFNILRLDEKKRTYAHLAASKGQIGSLICLLEIDISLIDKVDANNHTPLSLSIEEQQYFAAKTLIANNANVNIGGGLKHKNCLNQGINQNQIHLVRDLLNKQCKCDVSDENGNYPIHNAILLFNLNPIAAHQILSDILYNNCISNSHLNNLYNKKQYAPIHLAVLQQHNQYHQANSLQQLLIYNQQQCKQNKQENMFDINAQTGYFKLTPLHLACIQKNYSAVTHLLAHSADVFAQDLYGRTSISLCMKDNFLYKILKSAEVRQLKEIAKSNWNKPIINPRIIHIKQEITLPDEEIEQDDSLIQERKQTEIGILKFEDDYDDDYDDEEVDGEEERKNNNYSEGIIIENRLKKGSVLSGISNSQFAEIESVNIKSKNNCRKNHTSLRNQNFQLEQLTLDMSINNETQEDSNDINQGSRFVAHSPSETHQLNLIHSLNFQNKVEETLKKQQSVQYDGKMEKQHNRRGSCNAVSSSYSHQVSQVFQKATQQSKNQSSGSMLVGQIIDSMKGINKNNRNLINEELQVKVKQLNAKKNEQLLTFLSSKTSQNEKHQIILNILQEQNSINNYLNHLKCIDFDCQIIGNDYKSSFYMVQIQQLLDILSKSDHLKRDSLTIDPNHPTPNKQLFLSVFNDQNNILKEEQETIIFPEQNYQLKSSSLESDMLLDNQISEQIVHSLGKYSYSQSCKSLECILNDNSYNTILSYEAIHSLISITHLSNFQLQQPKQSSSPKITTVHVQGKHQRNNTISLVDTNYLLKYPSNNIQSNNSKLQTPTIIAPSSNKNSKVTQITNLFHATPNVSSFNTQIVAQSKYQNKVQSMNNTNKSLKEKEQLSQNNNSQKSLIFSNEGGYNNVKSSIVRDKKEEQFKKQLNSSNKENYQIFEKKPQQFQLKLTQNFLIAPKIETDPTQILTPCLINPKYYQKNGLSPQNTNNVFNKSDNQIKSKLNQENNENSQTSINQSYDPALSSKQPISLSTKVKPNLDFNHQFNNNCLFLKQQNININPQSQKSSLLQFSSNINQTNDNHNNNILKEINNQKVFTQNKSQQSYSQSLSTVYSSCHIYPSKYLTSS